MSSVLLDDFKTNKIYETLAMLLVSPPFDEDMLTFKVHYDLGDWMWAKGCVALDLEADRVALFISTP